MNSEVRQRATEEKDTVPWESIETTKDEEQQIAQWDDKQVLRELKMPGVGRIEVEGRRRDTGR